MSPICFLVCDKVGGVWVVQTTGRASSGLQEPPPGAEEVGGYLFSDIIWSETRFIFCTFYSPCRVYKAIRYFCYIL